MNCISKLVTVILLAAISNQGLAQDDSIADVSDIINVSQKFYQSTQEKYSKLNSEIQLNTSTYLRKLQQYEKKIHVKLNEQYFATSNALIIDSLYSAFLAELANRQEDLMDLEAVPLNDYNALLDTLSTSISFIQKTMQGDGNSKMAAEVLDRLKIQLNETEQVNEFISQRKEAIKNLLEKYTDLPKSLKKDYLNVCKTAYYYRVKVEEYKELLSSPDKIEKKVISTLSDIPAFQRFMEKNSQIASMFQLPADYGTPGCISGLQTRTEVESLMQEKIGSGVGAISEVQQNFSEAKTKLTELKSKLQQGGSIGSKGEIEMPDFKPNSQNTKTFLQRLEYGFNVQFGRNNAFLPTTSDLGLSIGYKLNDKSIIGAGMSYKAGLGTMNKICVTSEGIGLRSFVEWRIKNQFYLSGGYELNYNSRFNSIDQLKQFEPWQRSGLIGITKKYEVGRKLNGNLQVLFDFLARTHIPASQLVIFRIGYHLKE